MFASRKDVVVMGAGPAGLAVAAACAGAGMNVTCVASAPRSAWRRSFAVWSCELQAMGAAAQVEAEWRAPTVWLDDHTRLQLPHAYARLDVARMQAALTDAAERAGVTLTQGSVVDLEHDAHGSSAILSCGRSLRAAIAVDATGADSRFVRRSSGGAPAFQAAYGELVEIDADVQMALMDYRASDADPDHPPSFLYALPLAGGRVFLEETVLASRPVASFPRLAARLHARLAAMGLRRGRVLSTEHCLIPLGTPLPLALQRVVPFGAAASLVHPATGYQVARALTLAPLLARALATAADPIAAARQAHEALWPRARRQAWALYGFGMEAILRFDLAQLRAFLRTFFALPDPLWLGFLRGSLEPSSIAIAMARFIVHADPDVRKTVLRLLAQQHSKLTRPFMLEEPA